jgi:hypothetical protein
LMMAIFSDSLGSAFLKSTFLPLISVTCISFISFFAI